MNPNPQLEVVLEAESGSLFGRFGTLKLDRRTKVWYNGRKSEPFMDSFGESSKMPNGSEIYEPSEVQRPTLWTGRRLEDRLRRVIEVASQPMGGPTPVKPLSFSEAPVEWLASLAAYTVALPFKAAAEGIKHQQKLVETSPILKGGPRGETGEWTPEQYSYALDNMVEAIGISLAGMPGGGPGGPTSFGISPGGVRRMTAKGFRDITKLYKGTGLEQAVRKKIGPSYRRLMKGLKHIPEEVLEPLTAVEVVGKGTKPRKMGTAIGTHEGMQQRVTIDVGGTPEEMINVLFHEMTHTEQFKPHRELIESLGPIHERWPRLKSLYESGLEVPEIFKTTAKPGLEAHAYQAGDMFESAVRHLEAHGKKMDLPTFRKIYKQAGRAAEVKFGKKPGLETMEKIRTESFARRKERRRLWGEQEKVLGIQKAESLGKLKAGETISLPPGKVKFDGIQEGWGDIPSSFQYTIQSGPAKGGTFLSRSNEPSVVIKEMRRIQESFKKGRD